MIQLLAPQISNAFLMHETLVALNDVVRSGKVRYVGASSMFSWQLAKSLFLNNTLGVAYRIEERKMIPLCKDQEITIILWCK